MKYLAVALFLTAGFTFLSIAAGPAPGEKTKPAPPPLACPIDGKEFPFTVDRSGEPTGMRLDFKPLGTDNAPWNLPQCPECKFILFNEEAPEEEVKPIDREIVEKLKPFVLSDEYRKIAKENTTYGCVAKMREFLKAKPVEIGDAYLKASWQVDTDEAKCQPYLLQAYEHFVQELAGLKHGEPAYINISLVCGELERRTGRFTEAEKRMKFLKGSPATQAPILQDTIDRQLEFIAKKDSAPHSMDAEGETQMRKAAGEKAAESGTKPKAE